MKSKLFKKVFIYFLILLTSLWIPITASCAEDKEKSIYLTFDDGPGGEVTIKILDILKKEDVHATFFLIGNQIKGQEDTIKRMKDEGNSLGLHSMTHEKCNLYSSNEGFLKEMKGYKILLKM